MTPAAAVQPDLAPSDASPFEALHRLLDEIDTVVRGLPPDAYCARPAPTVSGTVGQHVRHCLDHVDALLSNRPAMFLSYDHRDRGTDVESDPSAAATRIRALRSELQRWSAMRSLDEPVQVISQLSTDGAVIVSWSTLARELSFVVSHTIHHQAIVAVLLDVCGRRVPERFGHAPSTPSTSPGTSHAPCAR
jgi:uncharacterized damage-inducible protein DinB